MATLHVRSFPDVLYRRLAKLADQEHRSLSAEVVMLLTRELSACPKPQRQVLADLDRWKFRPIRTIPSTLELLKADRGR